MLTNHWMIYFQSVGREEGGNRILLARRKVSQGAGLEGPSRKPHCAETQGQTTGTTVQNGNKAQVLSVLPIRTLRPSTLERQSVRNQNCKLCGLWSALILLAGEMGEPQRGTRRKEPRKRSDLGNPEPLK